MAEGKIVKLIAGATGIWTGNERIEPGQPFEATEAQAKHLLKKGAATEIPQEPSAKKGAKESKGAE
jgi:hypothetical protein